MWRAGPLNLKKSKNEHSEGGQKRQKRQKRLRWSGQGGFLFVRFWCERTVRKKEVKNILPIRQDMTAYLSILFIHGCLTLFIERLYDGTHLSKTHFIDTSIIPCDIHNLFDYRLLTDRYDKT